MIAKDSTSIFPLHGLKHIGFKNMVGTSYSSYYIIFKDPEMDIEPVFVAHWPRTDLSQGLVRSPHPLGPAASFQEDPAP